MADLPDDKEIEALQDEWFSLPQPLRERARQLHEWLMDGQIEGPGNEHPIRHVIESDNRRERVEWWYFARMKMRNHIAQLVKLNGEFH